MCMIQWFSWWHFVFATLEKHDDNNTWRRLKNVQSAAAIMRRWKVKTINLLSVNKLKQETDVVINIPDNDKGSTTIRIEGNKEGVKKAKEVSLISVWKTRTFTCLRKPLSINHFYSWARYLIFRSFDIILLFELETTVVVN